MDFVLLCIYTIKHRELTKTTIICKDLSSVVSGSYTSRDSTLESCRPGPGTWSSIGNPTTLSTKEGRYTRSVGPPVTEAPGLVWIG